MYSTCTSKRLCWNIKLVFRSSIPTCMLDMTPSLLENGSCSFCLALFDVIVEVVLGALGQMMRHVHCSMTSFSSPSAFYLPFPPLESSKPQYPRMEACCAGCPFHPSPVPTSTALAPQLLKTRASFPNPVEQDTSTPDARNIAQNLH